MSIAAGTGGLAPHAISLKTPAVGFEMVPVVFETLPVAFETLAVSFEIVSVSFEMVDVSFETTTFSYEKAPVSIETVTVSLQTLTVSLEKVAASFEKVTISRPMPIRNRAKLADVNVFGSDEPIKPTFSKPDPVLSLSGVDPGHNHAARPSVTANGTSIPVTFGP
jgi:hypothetical protein